MRGFLLAAACAVAATSVAARGAFVAVDTFESSTLGNVNGQNGWALASGAADVVVDPAGGTNKVLAATQTGTNGAVDLDKAIGAISGSGTLFYRFRFVAPVDGTTAVSDISFGLSDQTGPNGFGSFEPMVGSVNVVNHG